MDNYIKSNNDNFNNWSNYYIETMKLYNNKKNNIIMKYLSRNKNINENTVLKNLNLKWNLINLNNNESISYKFIDNLIKRDKITYTENELTIYNNEKYKNVCFDINNIIDIENIYDINILNLSLNPNLKWNDIQKYNKIKFDYGYLSRNKNIKLKNIFENMNKGWDFGEIVRNPIFHISKINQNKTFMRHKKEYFENPNFDFIEYLTYVSIKNYSEINRSIHSNENFNLKMINDINKLYPEFIFDYDLISDKKNIKIDYILSKNENWNIYFISQNPNLRFNFIMNYDYEWNYESMLLNTFDIEREEYFINMKNNYQ